MAKKKAAATSNVTEERFFEFRDAKSAKFWAIQLEGTAHTVRYGRMGTGGQSKTKDFGTEAKARASCEKLISQKTGKGYTEVQDQSESKTQQITAQKAMLKQAEPFLKAIRENPDDVDAYAVYADWLSEHGDARGEFMHVQMSLEDESLTAAQRKKLQKQEKDLLKAHRREWLDLLAEFLIDQKREFKYTFARGMLNTITCNDFTLAFGAVLKQSPVSRTLQHFNIEQTQYLEEDVKLGGQLYEADEDHGIATLKGAPFDSLRQFRLGSDSGGGCWTRGENAVDVIKKMSRLESLYLAAHEVDTEELFALRMPHLRSLTVHHLTDYQLEVLAKNSSLKNLESLAMFPHALEPGDEGAYLDFDDLKAVARSKHLKKLTRLTWMASNIGDQGVQELIDSKLLDRLKVLDLTYGCITDAGAELLAGAKATKNLDELILNNNMLTKSGVALLKSTGVNFKAQSQFKASQDDEEQEYLWYGDME